MLGGWGRVRSPIFLFTPPHAWGYSMVGHISSIWAITGFLPLCTAARNWSQGKSWNLNPAILKQFVGLSNGVQFYLLTLLTPFSQFSCALIDMKGKGNRKCEWRGKKFGDRWIHCAIHYFLRSQLVCEHFDITLIPLGLKRYRVVFCCTFSARSFILFIPPDVRFPRILYIIISIGR